MHLSRFNLDGAATDSIYKLREKWAECYMRDVFSLGVRNTQLSESFNNAMKKHLKSNFDIIRFLKHFERTVQEKRDNKKCNLNMIQGRSSQED